ncbi:hypothetical protein BC831DRAFT_465634 [Entophlyctis helioformis]|nr:hypothetical protein BC831DRAFT_465634 [Entophlyctis helioformis]
MCPSCSKVGCEACVKKWLVEEKSQCPHCRSPLHASQLVHCRFMDDLASQLHGLVLASPTSTHDVCPTHSAPMYYFCHDCEEGLCADCAVIDAKHKNHSFEHLHVVYKRHRARIDERTKALYTRFNEYAELLSHLNEQALSVTQAKQAMLDMYKTIWQDSMESLEKQEAAKISLLAGCKLQVANESDMLRVTLETLEGQLTGAWHTDIITNADKIIGIIDKLNPKTVVDFSIPTQSPDFESDMVPPYESAKFCITGFKTHQQSPAPLYSNVMTASGLSWRLKVYCSGNGVCRHECMSVFVELVSGTPTVSKYQYRVELINLLPSAVGGSRKRSVSREFTSEFAVGECWGYNRFYSLDLLEQEGFYDPVTDTVELVYYVRAPTYAQRCRDLSFYISQMQKNNAKSSPGADEEASAVLPAQTLATAPAPSDAVKASDTGRRPSIAPETSEDQLNECDITDLADHAHPSTPSLLAQLHQERSATEEPWFAEASFVAPSAEPPTPQTNRHNPDGTQEQLRDGDNDSEFDGLTVDPTDALHMRSDSLSFDFSRSHTPTATSSSQRHAACTETSGLSGNVLDTGDHSGQQASGSRHGDSASSMLLSTSELLQPRASGSRSHPAEDYQTSLNQLKSEMSEFETFVDAVTREVELFESIVRKSPTHGSPLPRSQARGHEQPSSHVTPDRPIQAVDYRRSRRLVGDTSALFADSAAPSTSSSSSSDLAVATQSASAPLTSALFRPDQAPHAAGSVATPSMTASHRHRLGRLGSHSSDSIDPLLDDGRSHHTISATAGDRSVLFNTSRSVSYARSTAHDADRTVDTSRSFRSLASTASRATDVGDVSSARGWRSANRPLPSSSSSVIDTMAVTDRRLAALSHSILGDSVSGASARRRPADIAALAPRTLALLREHGHHGLNDDNDHDGDGDGRVEDVDDEMDDDELVAHARDYVHRDAYRFGGLGTRLGTTLSDANSDDDDADSGSDDPSNESDGEGGSDDDESQDDDDEDDVEDDDDDDDEHADAGLAVFQDEGDEQWMESVMADSMLRMLRRWGGRNDEAGDSSYLVWDESNGGRRPWGSGLADTIASGVDGDGLDDEDRRRVHDLLRHGELGRLRAELDADEDEDEDGNCDGSQDDDYEDMDGEDDGRDASAVANDTTLVAHRGSGSGSGSVSRSGVAYPPSRRHS